MPCQAQAALPSKGQLGRVELRAQAGQITAESAPLDPGLQQGQDGGGEKGHLGEEQERVIHRTDGTKPHTQASGTNGQLA